MTEFLIGTGGWAYFRVPGLKPLDAYARAFNFVEVNSTFYEIPNLRLVESWRRRVPPDFEFSVRCHRNVTHKYRMEPVGNALATLEIMRDICKVLKARFLVLVTPTTLDFSPKKIRSIDDLFQSVDLKGVRLVWEVRRKIGEPVPSSLINLMEKRGIIHCVDISKEEPALDSDTLYTRVFGKGVHNIYQFDDEELLEIDRKVTSRKLDTAVISFHNVKMYKDAARYKIYRQTKKFPPVTKGKGQLSLKEVLMEDAKFPASKRQLIKDQGWKVIDLSDDRRVHAYTLLEKLPNRTFYSVDEVLSSLQQT
ncbi:hypothetical protein DRO55_02370 [Candidatus Bathyarchaeota archaeon]|nr:MAG: hypothetical protein DRO55_02370 [Candidatus Bathyarchaeota archaeon]